MYNTYLHLYALTLCICPQCSGVAMAISICRFPYDSRPPLSSVQQDMASAGVQWGEGRGWADGREATAVVWHPVYVPLSVRYPWLAAAIGGEGLNEARLDQLLFFSVNVPSVSIRSNPVSSQPGLQSRSRSRSRSRLDSANLAGVGVGVG